MPAREWWRVWGGVLVLLAIVTGNEALAWQFVAYGDMPYYPQKPDCPDDAAILKDRIAPEIRQRTDVPFVLHVGDTGRPEVACSDTWLAQINDFWETTLQKPVLFTPGDNDWTDCDRPPTRVSELARLDAMRQVFFREPTPLGPEWADREYERQVEFPENAMWRYAGVLFVTVHIVGTENGRDQILLDPPDRALALVQARDTANRDWLDRAFALATENDISALVVVTHADMFNTDAPGATGFERCQNQPAFAAYCEMLRQRGAALSKPVLLLHGDTDAYCLDQPFLGMGTQLMWRLNAPGDCKDIDAVVVSVQAANPTRPFEAKGLLSGKAVPGTCNERQ